MDTGDNHANGASGNKPPSSLFSRKIYETEAERKRDRWIGIGLFFGLNILLWICQFAFSIGLAGLSSQGESDLANGISTIAAILLWLLPWVINIGLIVYFSFTRNQIALGMLLGFALALAIVIVLGLIFMVACFAILFSSGGNL